MKSALRVRGRTVRWAAGAAVLMAVVAAAYWDLRHAPPVYPPGTALLRQGIRTVPIGGMGTLSPEAALSEAESEGLAGGAMAVRLVELRGFGYRGRAWEVSATHAQYQPLGGPPVHGEWVVLFFDPQDGRLLGYAAVNP